MGSTSIPTVHVSDENGRSPSPRGSRQTRMNGVSRFNMVIKSFERIHISWGPFGLAGIEIEGGEVVDGRSGARRKVEAALSLMKHHRAGEKKNRKERSLPRSVPSRNDQPKQSRVETDTTKLPRQDLRDSQSSKRARNGDSRCVDSRSLAEEEDTENRERRAHRRRGVKRETSHDTTTERDPPQGRKPGVNPVRHTKDERVPDESVRREATQNVPNQNEHTGDRRQSPAGVPFSDAGARRTFRSERQTKAKTRQSHTTDPNRTLEMPRYAPPAAETVPYRQDPRFAWYKERWARKMEWWRWQQRMHGDQANAFHGQGAYQDIGAGTAGYHNAGPALYGSGHHMHGMPPYPMYWDGLQYGVPPDYNQGLGRGAVPVQQREGVAPKRASYPAQFYQDPLGPAAYRVNQ